MFGPKGTGKSCILKAIAKHYEDNGIEASVYFSASDLLDDIFDMKGITLAVNLNNYDINYCTNEIEDVRDAVEVGVTSLAKYKSYFSAEHTNRNAKKILLKDIAPEEESRAKRKFLDFHKAVRTIREFLEFLGESSSIKSELTDEEYAQVTRILRQLHERLNNREWTCFSEWKEIEFLNSAITVFRREVERKTGSPAKPTTTGFHDYAMNRIQIELNAAEIVRNVDTKIPIHKERVGSLGPNKGELEIRTQFEFQTGSVTDGSLASLKKIKKGPQKTFINCIRAIQKHAYADELFRHVAELNEIDDVEDIETVYELLLFKKYFTLNGVPYSPSSGEGSMVMLEKELGTDKEVYILDEPEKSLGNEYISDVIVPLIKERARSGKKIFIATHDANIAVRTLPYSSIYRRHGPTGYTTYLGNPFSNNLANLDDANDRLDWKKISMKTLEGGEEAFGERGKIYGND